MATSSVSAQLIWETLDTPVGQLSVGCSQAGLSQVRFGSPPRPARPARSALPEGLGPAAADDPSLTADDPSHAAQDPRHAARDLSRIALVQIGEYFSGSRRRFDLPVDWTGLSGPRRQVLQVLFETVGYGQTVSYGTLAGRAGLTDRDAPVPARAVGQIMGSNPIPVVVPCHRVLAAGGLGGYSGGTGPEVKHWLLVFEGAMPPTLDWEPARLHA